MESIYNSLGAVIGFSVIVLITESLFDDKVAQNMILIVLLSMLLINSKSLLNFANKVKGD